MDVHTRENKTLPMYIMYANALNNTPSYTSYPCLPLTLVYTWYEESTPQLGQPSLVQLMSLRHPCVMCSLPNVWFCNTHTHTHHLQRATVLGVSFANSLPTDDRGDFLA